LTETASPDLVLDDPALRGRLTDASAEFRRIVEAERAQCEAWSLERNSAADGFRDKEAALRIVLDRHRELVSDVAADASEGDRLSALLPFEFWLRDTRARLAVGIGRMGNAEPSLIARQHGFALALRRWFETVRGID
jgi:hypothetical protein